MAVHRDHSRNTLLSLTDWSEDHDRADMQIPAPEVDAPSLAELLRRRSEALRQSRDVSPPGRVPAGFLARVFRLLPRRRRRTATEPAIETVRISSPEPADGHAAPQAWPPHQPQSADAAAAADSDPGLAAEIEAVRRRLHDFAELIAALRAARRPG